jgi:hypothetical protein
MKTQILSTLDFSKKLIVSPDIDGFTSASLLEAFNGSVVVGTYDKNVMTLADGVDPKECLFVDCDMNSEDFVSIGNHQRLSSGDNIAKSSFNPNVHFEISKYTDKYPFATAFLISFATRVPTSEKTQISMMYADSTYKNLENYLPNMQNWQKRMNHTELERVFGLSDEDLQKLQALEATQPAQGFVSKRFGKTRYIEAMNEALSSQGIKHLPLTTGKKFLSDKVGINTVMRYNRDIISYAEIYGGEYSVTYNQEMDWK